MGFRSLAIDAQELRYDDVQHLIIEKINKDVARNNQLSWERLACREPLK